MNKQYVKEFITTLKADLEIANDDTKLFGQEVPKIYVSAQKKYGISQGL